MNFLKGLDLGSRVAFLIGRVFPGHIFLRCAVHFGLITECYTYGAEGKIFLKL